MSRKIKTGDSPIVDEWVNNTWPQKAKDCIIQQVPEYEKSFKFRTSESAITIRKPIEESFRVILNYCISNKCFLAYNAAMQKYIRNGEKIRIALGKSVHDILSQPTDTNSISSVFQEIRIFGSGYVEQVLVIGENAIEDFCKSYKELIIPDTNQIPKGKTCIYADAGGEIQRIRSTLK